MKRYNILRHGFCKNGKKKEWEHLELSLVCLTDERTIEMPSGVVVMHDCKTAKKFGARAKRIVLRTQLWVKQKFSGKESDHMMYRRVSATHFGSKLVEIDAWIAVFWKRSIIRPLPLPLPHFRFHHNVVILLVAIPTTYLEAADLANRFHLRFQNPGESASSRARSPHTTYSSACTTMFACHSTTCMSHCAYLLARSNDYLQSWFKAQCAWHTLRFMRR